MARKAFASLGRLAFIYLCVVTSLTSAAADDMCVYSRNEVTHFFLALPRPSLSDRDHDKFTVKDARDRFQISYSNGTTTHRSHIQKTGVDENSSPVSLFYEVTPLVAEGYGSLFLNAYYLHHGYPCSYVVYPDLQRNTFTFKQIDSAQVEKLDSDDEAEIMTREGSAWSFSCLSNASRPDSDWRRIYHISPLSRGLIDVSERYPTFYASLAQRFRKLYGDTSTSSPDCKAGFENMIRNAEQLAMGQVAEGDNRANTAKDNIFIVLGGIVFILFFIRGFARAKPAVAAGGPSSYGSSVSTKHLVSHPDSSPSSGSTGTHSDVGLFSTECASCGSNDHATGDCPH